MNQEIVESLAQVILSLSDEKRQWLERELQKASVSGKVYDVISVQSKPFFTPH
ncbi:hypothetical protein [Leptolyngbya sp. BL0902]|uniref:hypothetical protein n=1 Tax=Leptolyngbya sp. BL0902 TaxID=1115757 RepID=UPI0018E7F32D|nr:hypothetical protein [Leptolyngbya sp. BL0902]